METEFAHETKFAQAFEEAQEDVERREKCHHKRTMHMWKNAIEHVGTHARLNTLKSSLMAS